MALRQPILFSFNLDKPPGFKIFKEPKIILYKKLNTDKLSHIKFYLEDDSRNPVSFQGETLTFTIQLIKIKRYNLQNILQKNLQFDNFFSNK